MNIVLIVLVIAVTAVTAVAILALFVWGAVKDGEADDQVQAKLRRRTRPGRRR